MEKRKLAMYMRDKKYLERFWKCLMNHYKDQYEIHVFETLEEIGEIKTSDYAAVLLEGIEKPCLEEVCGCGQVFVLTENEMEERGTEHLTYIEKYQEVYKIMDCMEKETGRLANGIVKDGDWKESDALIGVISFSNEIFQLPFAAVAAEIYGEKDAVLMIDLQAYSGLAEMDTQTTEELGMEDLMTIVATGNYTKSRLLGAIGHEKNWDYIRPVKNTECLLEANEEIYLQIIKLLAEVKGYKKIIVNIGTVFPGIFEFLNRCNKIYCLTTKGGAGVWREQSFRSELKRKEKDALYNKICKVEIPSSSIWEKDWKEIAKQWLWNTVGNQLREEIWVVNNNG